MNWRYKAMLQLGFSVMPLGEQLNHFFQRHVAKSLPLSDATFANIASTAKEHIDGVQRHLKLPFKEATFYEFGAGWDLTIPLAFYALGVQRQIVADIRFLLRPKEVNDPILKFQRVPLTLGPLRKPDRLLEGDRCLLHTLKEYYGIEYKAPCDARDTGLASSSVDCITSTSTLEHIPQRDLLAVLSECHRLLNDDGVISFRNYYDDHYSYFDRHISRYNFLRYSDRQWAVFSPKMHYQNRLRHRDYLDLFRAAGFETVEERRTDGTSSDLETIERLPLDKRFGGYSTAEMAVHDALIVLQKSSIADRPAYRGE
ncbi:class I SAM-dependent methyltransferase [Chloroflexota bacterium]